VRSCDGFSAFSFLSTDAYCWGLFFRAADVTKLLLIKQHKMSESEIYYLKKYWYPSNFCSMSCSRFQYLSCNHSNTEKRYKSPSKHFQGIKDDRGPEEQGTKVQYNYACLPVGEKRKTSAWAKGIPKMHAGMSSSSTSAHNLFLAS